MVKGLTGVLALLLLGIAMPASAGGAAHKAKARPRAPATTTQKARPLRRVFKAALRTAFRPNKQNPLDEGHYEAIKTTAFALYGTYAPATHFFLGIGRSPADLIAFMRNLDPHGVGTMPLSGFQGGERPIAADTKRRLDELFDSFIPSSAIRSKRDIVLVDRWASGGTLLMVRKQLSSYLKARGYTGQVKIAGIARIPRSGKLPRGVTVFEERRLGAALRFQNEVALVKSPHEIEMGDELSDLRSNPEYRRFRNQLMRRMRRDQDLDRALRELVPTP